MQQLPTDKTWILLLRRDEAHIYESTCMGQKIIPVRTFQCEPASINTNALLCKDIALATIAAWLDEAGVARRYQQLKLLGDSDMLRELLVHLANDTRALVSVARAEDLSNLSKECVPTSLTATASALPYVVITSLQLDDSDVLALREACRLTQRNSPVELHLVHVVAPSLLPQQPVESTAVHARAQLDRVALELTEHASRAGASTSLKIFAHVRTGSPAQALLRTAGEFDADVIVISNHPRGKVEELRVGSVTEQLLHEAPCSVMVAAPKSFHSREIISREGITL